MSDKDHGPAVRIIPKLDIKGPNLVKGVHCEGLRVLGKPEAFASHYYEAGADELIYMDAVASLYGRNSLVDIVEQTSRKIFIPLTVGGGLRTIEDIRAVLRSGADKVSINTAAIRRPELIREASRAFGSSTIVVAIEAIRRADGSYEAYIDYGREATGVDAVEWSRRAVDLGAGELLVTSIDREGTGEGFDLELTKIIAESVPIPVIAAGGAGEAAHVYEAIEQGRADAVSVASVLHYNVIRTYGPRGGDFSGEGNVEFLSKRASGGFSRIRDVAVPDIKKYLAARGVNTRPVANGAGHE